MIPRVRWRSNMRSSCRCCYTSCSASWIWADCFGATPTAANAAQTAARCFAIKATACQTATATQNYAATQAYGIAIGASAFTVTTPACGVQVAASYVFNFVVPWFYVIPFGGSNTITLSTTTCYPV